MSSRELYQAGQLDILADAGKEVAMGTLLYRSALEAAKTRRDMFEEKTFP